MREGELFAMQWSEVNFDKGTIDVTHTLTKGEDGQLIRSEPKTDESRRTIYLDDETIQVLLDHKNVNEQRATSDLKRSHQWREASSIRMPSVVEYSNRS
jgi:integrase